MRRQLQLLAWQQAALSIPDEYDILLSGGRGGGKSTLVTYLIIRDVIRFGKSYVGALVRKDLAGLKKLESDLVDLMDATPELRGSKYLGSSKEFKFSNGATLYLHYIDSSKSFGRFQGIDLSHLYIDEVAQLPEPDVMLRFRSSLRSPDPTVKPRTVLTANPGNAGSWWVGEQFVLGAIPWKPRFSELLKKNLVYVNSTLFDNPFISDRESYIQTLRASCNFDEAKIEAEVYGRWSTVSGSFFGHVLSEDRSKIPWRPVLRERDDVDSRHFYLGMDWGTRSPASLILGFKAPHAIMWGNRTLAAGSIILLDEFYSATKRPDGARVWNMGDRTLTTKKMALQARELCKRNGLQVGDLPSWNKVADSAITAVTGSDEGSIADQLKDNGLELRGVKGRRADGWQVVSGMLEAAGDPTAPGLYVTEKVESFWATFPGLVYDSRNPEDLDSDGIDHTADAVRYLLVSIRDQSLMRTGARFR